MNQGNLFSKLQPGHTLINPVNTVGVMGAGLAKQVKQTLPQACAPYYRACRQGLQPGELVVVEGPIRVIHVATKQHYKDPSQMAWVEQALYRLAALSRTKASGVWHLPPIGAGLGGLSKKEVLSRILAEEWGCELWLWNF